MGKMEIKRAMLGMLGTNCYFISNTESGETVIVDPADEADAIRGWCMANGKKPVAILLTHGHYDHMMAADEVRRQFSARTGIQGEEAGRTDGCAVRHTGEGSFPARLKIYAAEAERELLENANSNLSAKWSRPVSLKADEFLKDGDVLKLAGFEIQVIATPGHTAGGLCYYIEEGNVLFSGDTLFAGSYGRTDFPTSSMSALARSIRERLFVLPEGTAVYPGHGESTSIGEERMYNPIGR